MNRTAILLIECNAVDAHLIRKFLGEPSYKFDVFHSETFLEGMGTIQKKDIDLVLLNLELPDSKGFRTLTRYMEQSAQIPVLILAETNNEIIGNQSIKAGAQDYLVKGQFDGKLLGRTIRFALQRFSKLQSIQLTTKKLSVSERRFREAQLMAHFGNWEMDPVGNEMWWSDEVFRIFGLQTCSICPTLSDYINYVHPEDRAKVFDFFDHMAKDGKQRKLEHRIITNGRSIKFIDLQAKVSYEDWTEKLLLVGVLQDITERKTAEISTQTQRYIGKRLESEFAMRKYLSAILRFLQLIEQDRENEQLTGILSELKNSTGNLSQMLHALLNLSLLESDESHCGESEINIKELVLEVQNILQCDVSCRKKSIKVNIPDDMPENLIADPRKISLLLHNLTIFAVADSTKKGEISLTVRVKEKDFKPFLFLSIEISGAGLSIHQIQDILDKSYPSDLGNFQLEADAGKIAMLCARQLSDALGGKLNIQQRDGFRTVFSVEFPVKVAKQSPVAAEGAPGTPLKVLLVEDHFLNRIATKKLMTSWSEFVSVDFAENGRAAVEKCKQHKYDLVLMDIQMPVMDGVETTLAIRSFSAVPIIALSSDTCKQEAERCFAAGCDDYLSKPIKARELYTCITNVRMKGKVGIPALKVK